jgi:hypothetical protein
VYTGGSTSIGTTSSLGWQCRCVRRLLLLLPVFAVGRTHWYFMYCGLMKAWRCANFCNSVCAAVIHSSMVPGWLSQYMIALASPFGRPWANSWIVPSVSSVYPASFARCLNVAMYPSRSFPCISSVWMAAWAFCLAVVSENAVSNAVWNSFQRTGLSFPIGLAAQEVFSISESIWSSFQSSTRGPLMRDSAYMTR